MWYQNNILSQLLRPLSWLYRLIISIRHFLYQKNIFKIKRVNVPVIVVGNITVGGSGKTPYVIALTKLLQARGFKPGVIIRGYRGKSKKWPIFVDKNSDPVLVGDEAVVIARQVNAPVVAGPNRFADAQQLIDQQGCDVIISDDGLQHYALYRDIEIALMDPKQLGNGYCLPAGPLREPVSRLKTVTHVVKPQFALDNIVSVLNDNNVIQFSDLAHQKIIAVVGIANPYRFFDLLRLQQIQFRQKIFRDHHFFQQSDFDDIAQDEMILMTEKDAVKCRAFCDARFWCVRGHAVIDSSLLDQLERKLRYGEHRL